MRPDLDKALVRDFPALYRDRHGDSRDTRMCDGFPGDGWEPLIRRVSEKIEPFCVGTDLRASQVKQKGGELRVYLESSGPIPDEVSAAVELADEQSRHTCEGCGAAGQSLCDACATFRAEWVQHRFAGGAASDAWRDRFRDESGRILQFEDALRRWRTGGEGIRVFLDDVRDTPENWVRAYTAHEAIALLEAGGVVEISLDHDLGDDEKHGTGYTVACWIEERVALDGFDPPTIKIHSANSVGRARMQQAIASIEGLRRRELPP